MIATRRSIFLAVTVALSLSACSGGGQSSLPAQPQTQTPPYSGPATLANFQWGQDLMAKAQYVGPAHFGYASVDVLVNPQNASALEQYALSASDPSSANYRRFLTPQDIANRYGATQKDYQAAQKYFSSYGLSQAGWPQREILTVAGKQSALEAAFGTKFATYAYQGVTFAAPSTPPHFSTVVPVTAVGRLVRLSLYRSYMLSGPGLGGLRGYSPQQLGRGFDYSGAWEAGYTGSGITIGIMGTGPISSQDVPALGTLFGAKVATVTEKDATNQAPGPANGNTGSIAVDPNPGGLAPVPPVTAPCATPGTPDYLTCNPEDGEAQIDTEETASLAPGSNVTFYNAYNPALCIDSQNNLAAPPCPSGFHATALLGIALFDDEVQQAIADNTADVVSISIGLGEPLEPSTYVNSAGNGIGQIEMASLAAEGIAVFVSSGDTGAFECTGFTLSPGPPVLTPCVSYPAGDSNVTSVGGVNIPLDATGKSTSQITAWGFQTTLGGPGDFANDIGSGGGVSTIVPPPPYQKGLSAFGVPGTLTGRAQPDVSLDADPSTGPALVENAPFPSQMSVGSVGGTSVSAPEMAAMWALVLQACGATPSCATSTGAKPYRLGNAAPLLYAISGLAYAQGSGGPAGFTPHLPGSSVFYDVLQGSNIANGPGGAPPTPLPGGYVAGPGYDLVTGIGVPFAGHLIQAVTGKTVP
ncbi:MAG: S8/S53 family peptidase [Candidatus Eremiobacteraeota bacterium]|nr:S8/S53 family peptidase [Candidatus Eremiobacteraeota bacterium]